MAQAYLAGWQNSSADPNIHRQSRRALTHDDLLATTPVIGNSCGMFAYRWIVPLVLLVACQEGTGTWLAENWREEVLAECADELPDMQLLSRDERYLYQTCENRVNQLSPSLARIDVKSGKREILLYGLDRADGIKQTPDGTLWIGEETGDGLVWQIRQPDLLPAGQRVDRLRLASSDKRIRPILAAGRMAHEGLAFSHDYRFLYLVDEWPEGYLFRLHLSDERLQVFNAGKGWLDIVDPARSRIEAERLHGKWFERPEDMERLPDGQILFAETGNGGNTGRIWALKDQGERPALTVFLEDARIHHPDNLEWDARRGWLWISDDDDPSHLWAWDGEKLTEIARHDSAEITGVESSSHGDVYVNLQHRSGGPDLTLRLQEK